MRLADLIPMLQIAIGPVILISGVALLLGSMNNRLGRTIDRSRHLVEARNRTEEEQQCALQDEQLKILWRRAHILQIAITLAVASVLCAALLIIAIFMGALCHLEIATVVIALFISCLGCMIASLIFFLRDINMSLHALGMEIGETNGNQK
jgi:Protein of unknown function (DUF2721)